MFDELGHYTILAVKRKVLLVTEMEIYAELHKI